ncbi:MAG: MFS transporter [Gammaproteobacteria bacterium]|nr:MFS transporter [Gammaproteobacteria bacterium]
MSKAAGEPSASVSVARDVHGGLHGTAVAAAPLLRLSAFYLLFFTQVGLFGPYWSLYLADRGFDARQIGSLMAIMTATKIAAPYLWGSVADRSGRRLSIIRMACLVSLLAFACVPAADGFVLLALCMMTYAFFWNATLPQFEAVTLAHLGDESSRYSRVRLWGSIGFIIAVMAGGELFDRAGLDSLPWVVVAVMACIGLASFLISEPPAPACKSDATGVLAALRRPEVLALLLACFLMQVSHGPYYVFFSIYLKSLGYSGFAIGVLWSLGVLAEIVLFLCMPRIFAAVAMRPLFLWCFLLTALRWTLLAGFAELPIVVVSTQLLHAASYGLYHVVAIRLIHERFGGSAAGRGQALYSSIGFGAGGALGSLLSGYLWAQAGPAWTWMMAASMSLLGAVIVYRWLNPTGDEPAPAVDT